jgi:hypothetical protein
MQVLYVIGLDIAPRIAGATAEDVASICLEALGAWVGGADLPVPASALRGNGERELTLAHGLRRRYATWEHWSGSGGWATRVERRDIAYDGGEFTTRVTVGRAGNEVSMRVSMARELGGPGLTPPPPPELHQPGLVASLVHDKRVTVYVDGHPQDGRYRQVRSSDEVQVLAEALAVRTRLPILLLHTRTLEARDSAWVVANKSIGLMSVVTLDYRAVRRLRSLVPSIEVPYEGGLLAWADISAPPAPVDPGLLNSADREALRADLIDRVAPISVLTRGSDDLYRKARQAAQEASTRLAAERTAQALASGRVDEQLAALRAELDDARAREAQAVDDWAEAQNLADERGTVVSQLRAQLEQQAIAARYSAGVASETTPEDAPDLHVGDADSLDALAQHLEKATEGRIVFTERAIEAWRKADRYSTVDLMRGSLLRLAEVAQTLYDGEPRKIGHLDTWIWEQFGFRVSLQDDSLPRGLRSFEYEDVKLDRTPHVKVNDGVPAHECGRIYFAFDKRNQRLVVDHVGLHL